MSSGSNPVMGMMEYMNAIQANKNARAINATSSKWAPLLELNKSQGKKDIPIPKASFAKIMGPAIFSMGGSSSGGGGGGGGGYQSGTVADISGMSDSPGAEAYAGGQGEMGGGMGMDPTAMASMFAAGGGQVPKYAGGGGIQGMLDPLGLMGGGGGGGKSGGGGSSIMSLLPMLAMLAPGGGMVPGKEVVPGDSPVNDTKLIGASPGEVVLPKSVASEGMKGNKWKVAAYLHDVKKNGPGPLPVKSHSSGKAKSGSMSPWGAMCSGGKV